jgi:hypothetical protein
LIPDDLKNRDTWSKLPEGQLLCLILFFLCVHFDHVVKKRSNHNRSKKIHAYLMTSVQELSEL